MTCLLICQQRHVQRIALDIIEESGTAAVTKTVFGGNGIVAPKDAPRGSSEPGRDAQNGVPIISLDELAYYQLGLFDGARIAWVAEAKALAIAHGCDSALIIMDNGLPFEMIARKIERDLEDAIPSRYVALLTAGDSRKSIRDNTHADIVDSGFFHRHAPSPQ